MLRVTLRPWLMDGNDGAIELSKRTESNCTGFRITHPNLAYSSTTKAMPASTSWLSAHTHANNKQHTDKYHSVDSLQSTATLNLRSGLLLKLIVVCHGCITQLLMSCLLGLLEQCLVLEHYFTLCKHVLAIVGGRGGEIPNLRKASSSRVRP